MQRRELVLGAIGGIVAGAGGPLLAQPAWADALPVPASGKIGFRVMRGGVAIGEHHLRFTQYGDQLRVDIKVAAVVRVLGIAVYSYACTASEYWSGGKFSGLDSHVNHDGAQFEVHASPIPGGFAIKSTKAGNYNYTGQPAMLPLTYWNKAMLNATILNIETGRHYPAIVHSPGWNYLPTAEGGTLLAQRFDVTGKLHLSVWYDRFSQWAGLDFNVGGEIMFEKITS
jgi:hypothetical protein